MKKKITSVLVIAMVMFTTVFAAPIPGNINRKVQTTFSEKFSQADDVRWTNHEKYIKATFKMDAQLMFAYFDLTGEFMGVSRNILSNQLPINLQPQIKKELSKGWISEILEFATDDETTYYATIEKENQQVYLKSSGFNDWEIVKKVKKD